MSIDAEIAAFVAAHADAWNTGDVDSIADVMGLPQMLARSDGSTFIETDEELVAWIDARLAEWDSHSVEGVSAIVAKVEPLPDDAARVTTNWRLVDADGKPQMTFTAVDTLVSDDGDWSFVVTDLAGEDAAAWA